jgi:hypothetical protein
LKEIYNYYFFNNNKKQQNILYLNEFYYKDIFDSFNLSNDVNPNIFDKVREIVNYYFINYIKGFSTN